MSRLVGLVEESFPWAAETGALTRAARLREDLELDSIHLVELQVLVEDAFEVRFDPADEGFLDAFDSLGALAAYVARLEGAARG